MKKFFLPLLLLLSVLGLNQSAEKLRSLTQSTTGWEDYRAAGRLLYQTFGNLFSTANTPGKSTTNDSETKKAESNPIIFVSNHLSNAIVISKISASPAGIAPTVLPNKIKQWLIPVNIKGSHQQIHRGPDPAAGFRIFMEIVKRTSKLNLLF